MKQIIHKISQQWKCPRSPVSQTVVTRAHSAQAAIYYLATDPTTALLFWGSKHSFIIPAYLELDLQAGSLQGDHFADFTTV